MAIADPKVEDSNADETLEIPEKLPVLPVRHVVTFPYMIVPLMVSEIRSIHALDKAFARSRMIFLATQRDQEQEDPDSTDLYEIGTVGIVIRMLKMQDDNVRVMVQGIARAQVERWRETRDHIAAKIHVIEEQKVEIDPVKMEALSRSVHLALENAASLGKSISPEVLAIAGNMDDPGQLADLTATNLSLKIEESQEILCTLDPMDRLHRVHEYLMREVELLTVQHQISSQARDEIDKGQREYFLRQQLKAIQTELGEGNDLSEEIQTYVARAKEKNLPKAAREEFDRQVRRLEHMNPDMAEATTVRTYLDWMVDLPWDDRSKDNLNLKKARQTLNDDHFGLDRIKRRILEHLAVRKLKKESKGPILCFVGPPGTGKTSLGKSIAHALGRRFVRLSLGGVHDEAEIRGHRRTYVGAMPGRIIQGLHQAGTANPVFMMDEVDKLGTDFRGDPSSALLEVLDPEQNSTFQDNYIGVPFDLSKVLFIMTANVLDTIQPAFRDRMEVIRLSGYTEEEKVQIARRHIIPRQLGHHGLRPTDLVLSDDSIHEIARGYTREAGVRNLEREIATLCRKVAMKYAMSRRSPVRMTVAKLPRYLGARRVLPDGRLVRDQIGISTGMAWTPVGGEILFIEAQSMSGRGNLILTGQMGEVMRESAQAALSYARAHAAEYGIDHEYFANRDFHIHIPAGAIPKDGPSAGVTLTSALVSACTGRPVNRDIAMTGEITLRGDVLPVGGIKEKMLAARRAQIGTVILPRQNQRDLTDVPKDLRGQVRVVFVDKMNEVLKRALT